MAEFPPLLKLARIQTRQGALHEARLSASDALDSFPKESKTAFWLESARIYLHCCVELEEISLAQEIMDDVLDLLKAGFIDEAFQAQAETLLGSWLLAQGKVQESHDYLNSAITKATHSRDLETLTRALLICAFSFSFTPTQYSQALSYLDKIDVLLAEIDNSELLFTARTIRGYIYIEKSLYDQALDLLWKNYEQSKFHGFHLSTSGVLAQLARVYKLQNQNDKFNTFAELALKGLDRSKAPRLYKAIAAICPENAVRMNSHFDIKVDEMQRKFFEKTKGTVDFRSQHVLYDLALLFIKNPGKRFSKEDLVDKIWGLIYEPHVHDNLIYVSIKRLRTLIEPDAECARYILRDRKGYYFNQQTIIRLIGLEGVDL